MLVSLNIYPEMWAIFTVCACPAVTLFNGHFYFKVLSDWLHVFVSFTYDIHLKECNPISLFTIPLKV